MNNLLEDTIIEIIYISKTRNKIYLKILDEYEISITISQVYYITKSYSETHIKGIISQKTYQKYNLVETYRRRHIVNYT